MKKILVIGHFDWKGNDLIGAVVKARNVYQELRSNHEFKTVKTFDIYGWKKNKIIFLIKMFFKLFSFSDIVLVISDTSPRILNLFGFFSKMFHKKFYYVVVGASIGTTLAQNQSRIKKIRFIKSFFVETSDCYSSLIELGFSNVFLLRNFKKINPVSSHKTFDRIKDLRFCTFSRVNKDKGILEAINAIEKINAINKGHNYTLDIFGGIEKDFEVEFNEALNKTIHSHYCGVVDCDKTVETLINYDCLLFPTKYKTEGIPGTIVDAFASALPIVCSDWKMRKDLIKNGFNGEVFEFDNFESFVDVLNKLINNPLKMTELSKHSLESYSLFEPSLAIKPLIKSILDRE